MESKTKQNICFLVTLIVFLKFSEIAEIYYQKLSKMFRNLSKIFEIYDIFY